MLSLIKIKDKKGKKKIYVLGIPFYTKTAKNDFIKRSYLFSIFQTKTYKYKTSYYFLKIKFKEKINIENLVQNKNNPENLSGCGMGTQ